MPPNVVPALAKSALVFVRKAALKKVKTANLKLLQLSNAPNVASVLTCAQEKLSP
jgi:hypothetical protein